MPIRPPRPCAKPRCPRLTTGRYCEEHRREYRRMVDASRPTAAQRGYGARWQRARAEYLREHPWCVECLAQGGRTPATVVDHVVPHRGDPVLFWDRSNWAALCRRHHDQKTARQDGG